MEIFKKLTASVLSALISFSAVASANYTRSNENFSYEVTEDNYGRNAILTEIKNSKFKKISNPCNEYHIVEVADNASKAGYVETYHTKWDEFKEWAFVRLCVLSIVGIFAIGYEEFRPKEGDYKGMKLVYPQMTSVDLPHCKKVGKKAFADCRDLKTVKLSSCTVLGENSFLNCQSLKNINLPKCEKIGCSAFKGCNSLKKFSAPKVTEIGSEAFAEDELEEVYVPNCTCVNEKAFAGCKKLKKITVSRNCKFANNSLPDERLKNKDLKIVKE